MISFVVPAHNEERLLAATLEAIHIAARSVGEPYEIVVADDGSTDSTAQVAQAHGAVVVSVAHRQIAATRNSGARAAKGSLLVFVDADTQVNSRVIAAAVDAVRQGAVGGGAPVEFDGVVPLYARLILPVFTWFFRVSKTAAGCFIFCTREAFDAVGGFDEAYFGAEEIVMSKALRAHGRFVILDAPVLTSGRKLRTYSGREVFTTTLRLAVGGRKAVQKREGLEIWYADRRPEPRAAHALTPRTLQVLKKLFSGAQRQELMTRLEQECSAEVLGCRDWTPPQMERLWFAVIKLSHENPGRISESFALAKRDWRDLLMAAGFGRELDAHEKWWTKSSI